MQNGDTVRRVPLWTHHKTDELGQKASKKQFMNQEETIKEEQGEVLIFT